LAARSHDPILAAKNRESAARRGTGQNGTYFAKSYRSPHVRVQESFYPQGNRPMENVSGWILPIAALIIVGWTIIWYIKTMNRFARLAVKVSESDSGIDVALTKRFDTLTKTLDVTKAYAKHESEVLAGIVKLRKGMPMDERIAANQQMDEVTGRINILAESYPELRSSEHFKQLQLAVTEVEDHLQAARRIYNMNVSVFNQLLVTWPNSIVGKQRGHGKKEFFEADEQKKNDVGMNF
jgi:LemA protein